MEKRAKLGSTFGIACEENHSLAKVSRIVCSGGK